MDYGTLRSLLDRPSPAAFQSIIEQVDGTPAGERSDVLVYLEGRLKSWPASARCPTPSACDAALTCTGPLPWHWSLARTIAHGEVDLDASHIEGWGRDPELFAHIERFISNHELWLTAPLEPIWRDDVWRHLRALTLKDVTLSSPEWLHALEHIRFDALEELHLVSINPMGDEHIQALCRNPSLTKLHTLSLHGRRHANLGDRDADGVDALCNAAFHDSLTRFEMGGYDLYSRSLRHLFMLPNLTHLDLRNRNLQCKAMVSELAHSTQQLRTLRLPDTRLGADASTLLASPILDHVEDLHIELDPDHVHDWAARAPLEHLTRLTADVTTRGNQQVMLEATRLLEHILPAHGRLTSLALCWRDVGSREPDDLKQLLDLIASHSAVATLSLSVSSWNAYHYSVLTQHALWSRLEEFIMTDHDAWQRDVFTNAALRTDARPHIVFRSHDLQPSNVTDRLGAAGFDFSTRHRHHDLSWHTALG